ncbi:MAG: sigma-70 family RNA polymerase sigma factor [Acidimicrobiia bacterium]|nr:sigma-70 family RNA polymerase sigma factor [Acidimicrobiia bacterium]
MVAVHIPKYSPMTPAPEHSVANVNKLHLHRPTSGRSIKETVNFRFVAGDPHAVQQIYQQHGRALFGVAYRILGDSGLAEEALQQAFLQAWRSADRFDPARNIAPWLTTITKRTAIDVYRRERRHRADELGEHDTPATTTSIETVWEIYRVRMAIEQLPAPEQEVLLLTHFSGMTHEAAAKQLDIPVGTVKSRSYRAYRKLSELLSDLEEAVQ